MKFAATAIFLLSAGISGSYADKDFENEVYEKSTQFIQGYIF